jgi:hypothetical protein
VASLDATRLLCSQTRIVPLFVVAQYCVESPLSQPPAAAFFLQRYSGWPRFGFVRRYVDYLTNRAGTENALRTQGRVQERTSGRIVGRGRAECPWRLSRVPLEAQVTPKLIECRLDADGCRERANNCRSTADKARDAAAAWEALADDWTMLAEALEREEGPKWLN